MAFMSDKKMAPHLVDRGGEKGCSACSMIFKADVTPSISRAFAEHIRQVHRPEPKPVPAKQEKN
jgi:hypothetical protein